MVCAMARPWKHPATGVYWYRKVVPAPLRAVVGQRELKWSLGTKDAEEAKRRYPAMAARAEHKLKDARRGIGQGATTLTAENVLSLGVEWLRRELAEPDNKSLTPDDWAFEIDALQEAHEKGQRVAHVERELRGLEAQRDAVAAHAPVDTIIREYQEVESGKRQDRPQLDAALRECKRTGATLLVAKLDRLARNVEFTARLMNSGVDFVAADFPSANRLTIHILAAMAEHEREQISQRTKAALGAAKRRGTKLGGRREGSGWRGRNQSLGPVVRAARADAYAQDLRDVLADIGPGSLRHIAAQLTARNIRTPRGGSWTAAAVRRLNQRIAV